MHKLAALAGVMTLAVNFASAATAQSGGMMGEGCPVMDMMGSGHMGYGMGQNDMGPGMMGGQMAATVEARLAYLHTALAITAAQETAWQGYALAVRQQVAAMQQSHTTMWQTMHAGTAPDRMAARIAAMSAMLAAVQALQPATVDLYAALDATQKTLADQLIGMECGAF